MRPRILLPLCIAVLALCTAALSQDVHTDYDHHVNFSNFHTYSWAHVKTTDPLWENRITDAVDHELEAKGWRRVPSGGDVAITAVGSARNQQEYQTFYNGLGGGWFWGGFGDTATTSTVNYTVGTLVIDMYDANSKRLIWRGTASKTLSDKVDKNEKTLEKSVDKMFDHFPPGEKS